MNDFKCELCKFCTKKNKRNQVGLCIDEHSPRNARGEPMKTVYLWSPGCNYGIPVEEPKVKLNEGKKKSAK